MLPVGCTLVVDVMAAGVAYVRIYLNVPHRVFDHY